MQITIHINSSEGNTGEDGNLLVRLGLALGGREYLGGTTATDPQPAAARKPRETRSASQEAPTSTAKDVGSAASATEASSAPSAAQAGPAATSSAGPTATTPASPSDAPVTEADIIAAANAAAGTIGPAGPAKIRDYIKANFKKADGTEGTLKTTAPDQQPRLLADLQKIARGELKL